jgi:transcriptional regulator with XRE-family HTH domain
MFLARRRRGLTQQQVADAVGVTQPRISAWESGTVDIPPRRAEAIADLLEVSTDDLREEA